MTRRRGSFPRWAGLVGVALALALAGGELLVRASGRTPWRGVPGPRGPDLYVEDPELGWRIRPGHHVHPGYGPRPSPLRITVLEDGSRATGFTGDGSEPWLALVGGSFVQGWGLSDEQTLAWKLQALRPDLRVSNHGVGGYGTHQSLLVVERLLARPRPPALVVYGFIPLHELRNVADPGWLESLARAGRSGLVAAPFASLDADGELIRHPPTGHPRWPLRERSALVAFGEILVARARAGERSDDARDVTLRLLAAMQRACAARGAGFAVAFLWAAPGVRAPYQEGADPRPRLYRGDVYASFLRGEGIPALDCSLEITPERTVPGEGHPGPGLNELWARCLAAAIEGPPRVGIRTAPR